ncbi:lon protease [endosymbiont of Euscepes postfasciatus]|uniref:endopeptidase La n=1 Tax=endosymbiont of Euscepes postfasciatus TaxID=650377 RepID=UPI000DC73B7A|nr:endopeptidase La [endosymbiont of Euscepes postfasciatus]BBA84627.1 lon protease [endosymbiont of Euscepes postfasciatus]
MDEKNKNKYTLPILPLRDIVIYPNMLVPLFVGREKSIKSLNKAINNDKKIILVTQKSSIEDYPADKNNLYSTGTMSNILQILKLPDGTIKILIEGISRVYIDDLINNGEHIEANVTEVNSYESNSKEYKVMIRTLINQFETYIKLNKKISPEIIGSINNIEDKSKIIDTIASNIPIKVKDKQYILEEINLNKRLEFLIKNIEYEIELLHIEKKIRNRIKKQMEKGQREYYLNEQIKAIQKELGEINNTPDEYEIIKNKINLLKSSKEIKNKLENELNKLKTMSSISAESTVIRSYIDCILSIPWKTKSKIKKDLKYAKNILDNNHYGLYEVKERILEYLAVQNRNNKISGPIICLIGPPGVGKTSLGHSIAKSTGRKFERISLGGLRDEAEIRGHRRTYIGSMPGKIIQKMSKCGVINPLILLDEIDKMSSDIRGDPSSALLEVLDTEQNKKFNDHYLEIDYDLSNVMFIATANSMNISKTLLDRMEIIKISGYSEAEKINIVNKYIIQKQLKSNALKANEINISNSAIISIIRNYTKESGLRNLEREISKIFRKCVKRILISNSNKLIKITKNNLKKFLGISKFDYKKVKDSDNFIGKATGLAWTELGGEILYIESSFVPGKGKLIYTGSLGKVMQESIKIALTVMRYILNKINKKFNYYNYDIHVHSPEGAIPKDGPSAGITICTSLISAFTNISIKSDIAMTGEITLQGDVLPIGGLKEKLLAAKRGGIKKVIIPYKNLKNLYSFDKNIISNLDILPVKNIKDVISNSFTKDIFKT